MSSCALRADHPFLEMATRLGLAAVFALPVGWARGRSALTAGARTHPLLSVCICAFLLVGQRAAWGPGEQADAFYGVLNGIGFVGSGAIVKSRAGAAGVTTAVSLWVTGAIGASAAYGRPLVAAALSLMSVLALWGAALIAPTKEGP